MKRYQYKTVFFSFLIFSLFRTHFAAGQSFKGFAIAGFNASQINGDGLSGFDKFGLNFGAGVSRKLSKQFGAQFEIAYSSKGSKDVTYEGDPVIDSITTVNYIEVPVMVNYYLKDKNDKLSDKFLFQAGIYSAFLINARFDDGVLSADKTSQYYFTDYGVLGGVEYEFLPDLSASMRLSTSLINTNRLIKYYHFVTGLTLRYTF